VSFFPFELHRGGWPEIGETNPFSKLLWIFIKIQAGHPMFGRTIGVASPMSFRKNRKQKTEDTDRVRGRRGRGKERGWEMVVGILSFARSRGIGRKEENEGHGNLGI